MMIERYALEPMKSLWGLKAQYERWLKVELAVVKAYEELGRIPKGIHKRLAENARIDVDRILEIEKEVDHDVIAFIKAVTEKMGDEARYFHYGLTSSDVVDTALSLALVEACDILIDDLEKLLLVLMNLAEEHRYTPIIGRTHGVHAEPTTFGLKVLSWYAEMGRNLERLKAVREEIAVGKISGAVGNYANVDPEVEELALSYLGLKPTPVSTQVVNRDAHAYFVGVLALVAAGIERMAQEIRHLQRTEVLEVEEPFRKGQRGSSAMPHKKNPILCERLTGMSRIMRAHVIPAIENISLWHERDISHSSVERFMFPDVTGVLHYMLVKGKYLVENLKVNSERMRENIYLTRGLVFSQRVMLKLVEKGMSREEAYKLVQKHALECWESGRDFKESLLTDEKVREKLKSELDEVFNLSQYFRHVDTIFARFQGGCEDGR